LLPGRPLRPSEFRDYLIDHANSNEQFSERFLSRLNKLNEIVGQSGERLEGNLFYWDGDENYVNKMPAEDLAPARRNIWRATRFKRRMLEVGVNAGHSALLALSSNPNLEYYGVDINWHPYTEACVEFLRREFPGRVHFLPGDSREVLPWLATREADLRFDVFHVDGGHTTEICRADISNCIRIADGGRGRHLLLDDINASWIFDVYCEFVALGYLVTETFFGDWEDANRNVLAKIL